MTEKPKKASLDDIIKNAEPELICYLSEVVDGNANVFFQLNNSPYWITYPYNDLKEANILPETEFRAVMQEIEGEKVLQFYPIGSAKDEKQEDNFEEEPDMFEYDGWRD